MKSDGFDLNNPVEKSITDALISKRFPHAVIFEGGSPSGRRQLAETAAAALICHTQTGFPCGSCSACKKAAANSHPDILIYSVEDKPKAFKVDTIREIRSKAYIVPNEADRKIFILENAHTMGAESQNALLKILEEPPAYVNFMLLCSSRSAFLPTVLSRATVFSLGQPLPDDSDALPRETVVEAAMGIARSCAALEEMEIVKAAAVFEKDPKLLRAALPAMQEIFAAALRIKYSAPEDNSEFGSAPQELAQKLSRRSLLALTEITDELEEAIRLNANHNLTVTALCTKLRSAVKN